MRWVKELPTGGHKKPRGRPRTAEEIRDLAVQMARETGWGHRPIHGELRKHLKTLWACDERAAHELCEYSDQQRECRPTHIVRDRDGKFTPELCSIVESAGIEFRPTPARSPNLNAFAETWVRAVKHECLDHFLVFGERQIQYLLDEYVGYFHEQRPHQGLGNRPPIGEVSPPELGHFTADDSACRESLGGLLKRYERKAA